MKAMDDMIPIDILSVPVLDEKPWAAFAACKDHPQTSFFPLNRQEEAAALAICAICPVREDCLDHALATNERFGVWGGATEKDRRRLLRL
jgi:WhiB family redox-sensing transcriptional regulator